MYIKIVKCSLEIYWYNHEIGNIFRVYEGQTLGRIVYKIYGMPNQLWIEKDDCIEIEDTELLIQPEENFEDKSNNITFI